MKQLLIVNSAKALNAKVGGGSITANDFSGLDAGAIAFFELGGSLLAAAPTKNFGIVLGGGADKMPFVIPEVDIDTLTISKAFPKLGTAFKRKFTMPNPVVGKDYTVVLVKKATVPHERNTWTCTVTAASTTAATEAAKFKKVIEDKLGDVFTVTVSGADVTIVGKKVGDAWEAKFADELTGRSWAGNTDYVDAEPTIGDKVFIEDLASRCAAGKGFTDTMGFGPSVYPGYPEAVEDLTPNTSGNQGVSTAGYALFTLRFKVGRAAAKTRDERVAQIVHIAVPITMASSGYSTIEGILPEGDFKTATAPKAATTTTPGSGYLTKTVADTLYDPI